MYILFKSFIIENEYEQMHTINKQLSKVYGFVICIRLPVIDHSEHIPVRHLDSPVQHKHRRVFLQTDAQQQLLHRRRTATVAARQAAAQLRLAATDAARTAGAATAVAILRQHLDVDELEVSDAAGQATAPNAGRIHRHYFEDIALL